MDKVGVISDGIMLLMGWISCCISYSCCLRREGGGGGLILVNNWVEEKGVLRGESLLRRTKLKEVLKSIAFTGTCQLLLGKFHM